MNSTKTIGIIGGGQLGQMMAISAIYMGHKVVTLDPAADCPASHVSDMIVAPYDDVEAMRELAERCDVLTYEFENVDADALDAVVKEGQLPQGTDLLCISQNRIFEKDFLAKTAGVKVAPYKVVTSSLDLEDIDLSKKYVLKTATGGYDGHGQIVIKSVENLANANKLANSCECVLEEFVNFDLEISVIVSGNGKDMTVFQYKKIFIAIISYLKQLYQLAFLMNLLKKHKLWLFKSLKNWNCLVHFVSKCLRRLMILSSMKLHHVLTIQDIIQLRPVIFHNLTHIFWELSACHFQKFISINQLLC